MLKAILLLLFVMLFLVGCVDQIIRITSVPNDAEVYINRNRVGSTPLILTKDEIMPLWGYYGSFEQAYITVRKAGYADYILYVNEFHLPNRIHAPLISLTPATPP